MAVYTNISLDDIQPFLSAHNIEECVNFSHLHGGTTNTNYLIETDNHKFVLTLFEEINDVAFLYDVHDALILHSLPLASIINAKQKEPFTIKGKPAVLFSYMEGASINNASSTHCELIGHALATMHSISMQPLPQREQLKNLSWAINQAQRLLETDLSDDDAEIIQQELHYLSGYRQLSLPMGLIHADCFKDNVLFNEVDKSLQLSAIIDFEYAQYGAYMYDLAIVINDWCSQEDGSLDRLKMRDILIAYSKVRPLEPIENQSIPMMLRATAFRFWISRLSDGNKKSPNEFKQRLLSRRKSLSGIQQ